MKIYPVPPDLVRKAWPLIEDGIQESLDHSKTHDAEDVIELCETGKNWLYLQIDDGGDVQAAAVVDVVQYPKGKFARAWLVGSNGKPDWKLFTQYLIAESQENGCRWFGGCGRIGWNKFVDGESFHTIRKEILQ